MLPSPVHDPFEFLNKARRLEWGSFFVSPVDAPVASVPCVANAVLPPQDGFCALAQRSTLARLLYSVTCVLIPAHSLDTAAVRWALIWSRVISPTVFFFAKNGFSTFRAYSFPNFRIRCLSTKKKTLLVQILIGITLNLQIALGRIDSFTVCDLHSMSTACLSICLGLLRFINIL